MSTETMRFILIYFLSSTLCLFSETYYNPTVPNDLLKQHRGDSTDSDEDGITDLAEKNIDTILWI